MYKTVISVLRKLTRHALLLWLVIVGSRIDVCVEGFHKKEIIRDCTVVVSESYLSHDGKSHFSMFAVDPGFTTTKFYGQRTENLYPGKSIYTELPKMRNSADDLRNFLTSGPPEIRQKHLLIIVEGTRTDFFTNKSTIIDVFTNKFASRNYFIVSAASDIPRPSWRIEPYLPTAGFSGARPKYPFAAGLAGMYDKLLELFTLQPPGELELLQRYITRAFVNHTLVKRLGMKIDTGCDLFLGDDMFFPHFIMDPQSERLRIYHPRTKTYPLIKMTGDVSLSILLSNMDLISLLAEEEDAHGIERRRLALASQKDNPPPLDSPVLVVVITFKDKFPFVTDFFQLFKAQKYPKKKMYLIFKLMVDYHVVHVSTFTTDYGNKYLGYNIDHMYRTNKILNVLYACQQVNCRGILYVDGDVQLERPKTFASLVAMNRPLVAPLLGHGNQRTTHGIPIIMPDFETNNVSFPKVLTLSKDIVKNQDWINDIFGPATVLAMTKRELLASICKILRMQVILVTMSYFKDLTKLVKSEFNTYLMCAELLIEGSDPITISNDLYYGHVINNDYFTPDILQNPDLFEIFRNPYTWEKKYLAANVWANTHNDSTITEVCPDVFMFQVFSEIFCKEVLEQFEKFGTWRKEDDQIFRKKGKIPKRFPPLRIDAHEIQFEKYWLRIVQNYIHPLFERYFYTRYKNVFFRTSFLSKYQHPSTVSSETEPVVDPAQYTVHVALNTPGQDFQGGGYRFMHYDCMLNDLSPGWVLLYPGAVTHAHADLPITNGTRYVLTTYCNPILLYTKINMVKQGYEYNN